MIGGSTAISNGTISVPGSPLQKAQGIEDSPEAMLKDLLKAGKGFCHPELTKTLVATASRHSILSSNTARNSRIP